MTQKGQSSTWIRRAIAIALVAILLTGIVVSDPLAFLNRNAAITGSAEYKYLSGVMTGLTYNLPLSMWYEIRSWFADPGSAEGIAQKAGAALNAGRLEAALDWAEKGLQLNKEQDDAQRSERYLIAACLAKLNGNIAKAKDYASMAVTCTPKDIQAQQFLYAYAGAAGDSAKAAAAFGAVAALESDPDALRQAAQKFSELGDYGEARRYYTLVIGLGVGTDEDLYQRGSCSMLDGDYRSAIVDFSRSGIPGSEYSAGMCEVLMGRIEQAESRFLTSIERGERVNESRLLLSSCKLEGGKYQEALDLLDQYVADGGAVAEIAYYRAIAYAMLGRYDEAMTDYDIAATFNQYQEDSLFGGATCAYHAGHYEEAIRRFDQCIRRGIRIAESQYYTGLALAATGDTVKARDMLRQAVGD